MTRSAIIKELQKRNFAPYWGTQKKLQKLLDLWVAKDRDVVIRGTDAIVNFYFSAPEINWVGHVCLNIDQLKIELSRPNPNE